ncbi:hypothetical protein RND81_11G212400 [Saponaria officinalis]|uniref:BSD domain-containing protein n=1 Tax=Saponaria officinalis TaxID=3572 RepID=A0AAW1HP05_SAPOF
MSWLLNSLANSLKIDDDDDAATAATAATGDTNKINSEQNNINPPIDTASDSSTPADPTTPQRGVKDDLSEFSKTFTRQLWGVAAFLAPPPPPPEVSSSSDAAAEDPARIAGIRNDLSEIGGKFRSEISKLSSNKAVSEFTKIASNLLQFGVDEDLSAKDYADRGVVGVTDEVVDFARDVAMHPETWLDFPLPHDDDDDDDEDFDLSDAQQEHAFAVERLVPELSALRTELCLGYMTEGSFWKIYFVLVHPRLSRDDAVILSTPPIMKARAMLTQELQNRGKSRKPDSGTGKFSVDSSETSHEEQLSVPVVDQSEYVPVEIISHDQAPSVTHDVEVDKHPVAVAEEPITEKKAIEEVPVKPTVNEKSTPTTSKSVVSSDEKDEDDADEWLKEEDEERPFTGTSYPLGHDDEDVSFSDLEEEDDAPASYKKVGETSSTMKKSSEVSNRTLKNKESNDWLDIEDIDDDA